MDNKETMIKEILFDMSMKLGSNELQMLENVLRIKLRKCRIEEENTELSTYVDDNDYIIKLFVANKRLENLSPKSIEQYVKATRNMLCYMNKNYKDITTNDIKYYLAMYQQNRGVSQNTLANIKRFLSAFFTWASDEEYIEKNPVRPIKAIKQQAKKKEFLTKEEIVNMRDACKTLRETALLDFLLSTGVRVSELTSLNIKDVDFTKEEVNIYATKTRAYRTGYLNENAKKHLLDYLNSREDDSEALFISTRENKRINTQRVQKELQNIAERAGVTKHVTVHLFRKTFATNLYNAGCDIVIIKELLGHANIATTEKHYASVNQVEIRREHMRCA